MSDKKMKSHDWWSKASLVTLACTLILTGAIAPVNSGTPSNSTQQWARNSLARYYAWFNAPWTADDRPYREIRNDIDHELAKGQKPRMLLQKYKALALLDSTSTKALFGYGYATYQASILPNGIREAEASQESGNSFIALEKISVPHTYNYARLRFLKDSLDAPDPELLGVGKRLLSHDPSDYEAEYALAITAYVSPKPADRLQAAAYQQDLAKRFPQDPRQYKLKAWMHYITAIQSHSQKEAEKSIALYQQYAANAPEFRVDTEDKIRIIKALQEMWRKA